MIHGLVHLGRAGRCLKPSFPMIVGFLLLLHFAAPCRNLPIKCLQIYIHAAIGPEITDFGSSVAICSRANLDRAAAELSYTVSYRKLVPSSEIEKKLRPGSTECDDTFKRDI